MKRSTLWIHAVLLCAVACARPVPTPAPPSPALPDPAEQSMPSSTAGTPSNATPATEAPVDASRDTEAAMLSREGQALLEQSRDGDHYHGDLRAAALAKLLEAARLGDLDAQALYGTTLFSDRFMAQDPQPQEREAYVSALTYILVAAHRKHPTASGYMDLTGVDVETGAIPDPLPMPLSDLPREWIETAMAEAKRHLGPPSR